MQPRTPSQRLLARILTLSGLAFILAGVLLAILVDPILGVIALVGIGDLAFARLFLGRAERSGPSAGADSASFEDPD